MPSTPRRRHIPALAATLTAGLTLTATGVVGAAPTTDRVLGPPPAAAADTTGATDPAALTGTITGVGKITADDVSVFAEPDEETLTAMEVGQTGQLHPIPADAVTVSGNRYTVTLDPAALPDAYVSEQGVVTLTVTVGDATTSRYGVTTASVLAPTRAAGHADWSGPDWLSALTDVSDLARQHAAEGRSGPVRVPTAAMPEQAAVVAHTVADECAFGACANKPTSDSAAAAARAAGSATSEAADTTTMADASAAGYTLLRTRIRQATNATSYPVGKTKSRFVHRHGHNSTYGIGVNTGNGWYASGSKSVETGAEFGFAGRAYARSYRLYTEYGKYQYCNKYGYCYLKWRPIRGMSTGVENRNVSRPGWSKCLAVSPGTFARSLSGYNAYAYGAAVKFKGLIGIDLSGKRGYSTGSKLIYEVVGKKRLCGNNDWPDYAGKVMERFR